MAVAVYTDYAYHEIGGVTHAERAFALFLSRVAEHLGGLVVAGRLDPSDGKARYPLGPEVEFVPLPHYDSLARPRQAVPAMARSLRRLWRALDGVDTVWVLGPHPLALALAAMAGLRRRRVVLGVRQDFPSYVAAHRPGRRGLRLAALALEASYRLLARVCDTVVVGPALAAGYRRARRLLPIVVSLVEEADVVSPEEVAARDYSGALTLLSVGRLDAEKNPLALLDVLELLADADGGDRWRLRFCGEGELAEALAAEVARRGLGSRVELLGYVAQSGEGGIREVYRQSHVLVHSSWTEGLPQVLFEAFAAGLPVVATDVGGIAAAVGGAPLLAPPGDPAALAAAAGRVAGDGELRTRLVEAGRRLALEHTLDREAGRVAAFLGGVR